MHAPPRSVAPTALILAAALGAGGCATAKDPRDPLEPLNRAVFQFNDALDTVALKPAAKGYKAIVPTPVRGGVTNFFGNFRDVTTAVNDFLQLKIRTGASDAGRVAINSTLGIFGVFDVATHLGLEKHDEDFGQTLGHWGAPPGPYLVLPLLGPSDFRDAVGWVGDYFTDPEFHLINESPWTWIAFTTRAVNVRANLLDADRLIDETAIDKYVFLRDAFLQYRRRLIYDGNPPDAPGTPGEPRRKTLKEMEQELGLDQELLPAAPAKEPPAPQAPPR